MVMSWTCVQIFGQRGLTATKNSYSTGVALHNRVSARTTRETASVVTARLAESPKLTSIAADSRARTFRKRAKGSDARVQPTASS